jgi:hypothetical protein
VLKALLFFQLMFVVNQLHFPWGTGIPGVVPTNIIFVLILLLMRGKEEVLTLREPPVLQKALLTFIIAMGVMFVWAEVTASGDLIADLTYVKNACFYPLYYWMYLRCKQDEKTTRWMIVFVLVVAAVAGVEAIREGIDYGFGKYNPFRRASGPFGEDWHNSNRAGVFYGMFVAMFMALALFLKRQKLWRLAAIGGIVILVGGALFTYSRQAYILILFAFAVLLLRKSIVLAVVMGVILASSIGFLPDAVTQRVEETKQQGAHGEEEVDVSTQSRWEIWEGAMGMLKEHPLGVGLFRFRNNIGNYSKYKHMDAHNFYVLTIAEMGPQGEICLILLLVAMMRLSKFLRKSVPPNDPERQALALGFTVMSINVMLGNIYGSPFLEGAVMGPYWALAGLLERYMQFPSQAGAVEEPKEPREASLVERFPLAAHLGPPRT